MTERLAREEHDTLPDIVEPAENPHLVGHDEGAAALASAYRDGKLHHALLLTGPKGIGKATFAFHLAHHLLRHPDSKIAPVTFSPPDPASSLSRQIASGAHPSILHLTRPYNDKTKKFATAITVDEIRKVSRFLSMRSHDDSYRIVIVDPADDMNRNAANALLKNLEEPPARAIFVLISHSPGGLLPTIRSRCQTMRMTPLGQPELGKVLASVGVRLQGEGATQAALAERAGGSARQAILLTEYGGLEIAEAADRFLAQRRRDPLDAYKLADATTGREREIQFDILNQHLLDRVADEAAAAALSGDARHAARLSELWQEASEAIAETVTYNLDKRQHVVGLLRKIGEALTG